MRMLEQCRTSLQHLLHHMDDNVQPMKMVVGLGNPGTRYEHTRHNIGFLCLDRLAQRAALRFRSSTKHRAKIAHGTIGGSDVLLAKPQTYMNESGRAVSLLARYYRLAPSDIIVVYDDLDLPFGTIRVRARGSSGGHRGMQSIIDHLGTMNVPRVRVGIGRTSTDAIAYVLNPFSPEQERELPALCDRVADVITYILKYGVTAAMNQYNGLPSISTN
jgi:PTH1 family peptidyl-tRNA hydrolase